MAELKNSVKTFIVLGLAQFMTPSEVAEGVNEEFGIIVTRQQVRHYNPLQCADCGQVWAELFRAERERFTSDVSSLAGAHKSYRVRELDGLFRAAKKSGNGVHAAELLKQMAQEMGDAFTNRRELTGRDGGPMEIEIQADDSGLDYRKAAGTLAPLVAGEAVAGESETPPAG